MKGTTRCALSPSSSVYIGLGVRPCLRAGRGGGVGKGLGVLWSKSN